MKIESKNIKEVYSGNVARHYDHIKVRCSIL